MDKGGLVGIYRKRDTTIMKKNSHFSHLTNVLAVAGTIFLATGCATQSTDKGPKYVFYPPTPDAPRVQFLTAYGSAKDLRGAGAGNVMSFITGAPQPDTPIMKPYGVAVMHNNLYVCDTDMGLILQMDLSARKVFALAPNGPAGLKSPVNITVDDNGWFYIADSLRDQVVIIDSKLNLVATIGEKGVNKPRDVVVSKDRIYVGDIAQHAVHVFDKYTRAPLFDIPRGPEATNINSRLFQPINLTLDARGQLYVGDLGGYRVQVYDAGGNYVRTVGHYGDNYGEFARLKGVAVDRDNLLYAVDAAAQLVQIFDDTGRLLMWFGEPEGNRGDLDLPAKVVVDYDNVPLFQKYAAPDFQIDHLLIVTSQYGPHKVSVYGFGHKK
jgi:DNA-binding beta-propeller fold protein YncE